MTVNCIWCGQYVESSNLRFPGYCSPECRNAEREHREAARQARRRARDLRMAEDR